MLCLTYVGQALRWFQMHTANLHDIWRKRSDGFGNVTGVGEQQRRFNGTYQVVRLRVGCLFSPFNVFGRKRVVRQKQRVPEALKERFGHRVLGVHVRHRRRIRYVAEQVSFGMSDHR